MSTQLSEFFEADENLPDALEINLDPVVESSEEYNYVEPSIAVPAPDDTMSDQNPGYVNGAHT